VTERGEGQRRRLLIVETDGGSRGNPGPAGWGAVVRDADGAVLAERADFLGVTTNNVAEYSGLIAGLRAARAIDPTATVEVRADSKLLVEQMSGRWQIKHEAMRRLATEAQAVFPPEQVRYTWVPRAENSVADALANEAMDLRVAVVRDFAPPRRDRREAAPRPEPPAPDATHVPGEGGPSPVEGALAPGVGAPAARKRALGSAFIFTDADPVTIVLVRHGQTDMTAAQAYTGGDSPGLSLNARGRSEAARAADLVHRIGREVWVDLPRATAVLSSSMLRSQQTAVAIGRRLGVSVRIDDTFAECRFGEWDGLTAPEIDLRWPGMLQQWHRDPGMRALGGESMRDVAGRVEAAVPRLLRKYAGSTVVIATHTITIRAMVGAVTRLDPVSWPLLRIPPASLTMMRVWPDGHELTVLGCPSDL
jgi:broad specificity phosphatase PhoE/ribonuclease HI